MNKIYKVFAVVLLCGGGTVTPMYNVNLEPLMRWDEDGQTPMYRAALRGQLCKVKFMLEIGVCPNLLNKDKTTPLHGAVFSNSFKIVKLLLEYGANPVRMNDYGWTPYDMAMIMNLEKIVKLFPE